MRNKLLAISYCLIFFNPLTLAHEIWPYYIVFCLTITYKYVDLFIILAYFTLAVLAALIRDYFPVIDVLQGLVVIQTCLYLSKLDTDQMHNICYVFEKFMILSVIVGIMQFLLNNFQEVTYSFFSGRPSLAEHLLKDRKVVTLLAPEPAYAGAHMTSIFMFLLYCRRASFVISILFIILLIMTRAISILALLPLIFGLAICTQRYQRRAIIFVLSMLTILVVFEGDILAKLFYRLIQFAQYWFETGSVFAAENQLGSVRMGQVRDTVFTLFNDTYVKPYSFIGNLNIVTYSSLIIVMLPMLATLVLRAPITLAFALSILLISGPVLMSFTVASIILLLLEQARSKDLFRKYNLYADS